MKSVVRLVLVLLVLVVLAGGGYVLTHGEQPPAPVMVHRELAPHVVSPAPARNGTTSLPDLPVVGAPSAAAPRAGGH